MSLNFSLKKRFENLVSSEIRITATILDPNEKLNFCETGKTGENQHLTFTFNKHECLKIAEKTIQKTNLRPDPLVNDTNNQPSTSRSTSAQQTSTVTKVNFFDFVKKHLAQDSSVIEQLRSYAFSPIVNCEPLFY